MLTLYSTHSRLNSSCINTISPFSHTHSLSFSLSLSICLSLSLSLSFFHSVYLSLCLSLFLSLLVFCICFCVILAPPPSPGLPCFFLCASLSPFVFFFSLSPLFLSLFIYLAVLYFPTTHTLDEDTITAFLVNQPMNQPTKQATTPLRILFTIYPSVNKSPPACSRSSLTRTVCFCPLFPSSYNLELSLADGKTVRRNRDRRYLAQIVT